MTRQATASVIIPVHDAEHTLGVQLAALARQACPPTFEVVVVLNRCSDRSRSVALTFTSDLDMVVLEANDQAAASYARNVGARVATGELLLFCDADDEVAPGWVAAMASPLAGGGADIIGGRIEVDRTALPEWIYEMRYREPDGRCIQRSAGLPFVMSAALGCTSVAFHAVGGFDETFAGAGYEEVDLAARMLRAGFRIGEAPDAVVSYRPRTNFRQLAAQVRGYERGGVLMAAKEGNLSNPCLNRRSLVSRLCRRTVHLILRGGVRSPRVVSMHVIRTASRLQAERAYGSPTRSDRSRLPTRDFVAPLDTPIVGGLALEATTTTAGWYATEGVERRTLAVLDAMLPRSGTFLDCGANIGVFSVAAAMKVGATGAVVCFEPDPRTRTVLEANLRRHQVQGRVQVRGEAVGARRSRERFLQYANDAVSGLGVAPDAFSPGAIDAVIDVDVLPLREVVEDSVAMIKIDVEGFEPEVLQGADQVLVRCHDVVVVVELNPAALRARGSNAGAILDLLPADEWARWLVDDRTADATTAVQSVGADPSACLGGSLTGGYGNLVAVRHHRRDELAAVLERIVDR